MTYCVGMLVEEGLAMIADTRTNAGVDNISAYRKLHVTEVPGERTIALATAGNLSVTQTALAMLREGVRTPDSDVPETLLTVPSLFRAAQIAGHALRAVREDISPSPEAESVPLDASILVGGHVGDGEIRLYLVYSLGNFIECGADTPYLQIGEFKYGKPVLERALKPDTPLDEAVKLGLISFDSTIRSNIAVAPPLDMMVLRRGAGASLQRRVEADDPYFRGISTGWSRALDEALRALPTPPWLDGGADLKLVR